MDRGLQLDRLILQVVRRVGFLLVWKIKKIYYYIILLYLYIVEVVCNGLDFVLNLYFIFFVEFFS